MSNAILAMTAGDVSLQAAIYAEVGAIVNARIAKEPQNWWEIAEVAELWRRGYMRTRNKRAAAASLELQGLDIDSFLVKQARMRPSVVNYLVEQMAAYQCEGIETIIAGVDQKGAHIYRVDNGAATYCHDTIGFAAIGNGGTHANSQLMQAKYGREQTVDQGLLLTYVAKKRAEVAPGVGVDTDMFMVGPQLGNSFPIGANRIAELDKMYQRMSQAEKNAMQEASKSAKDWLKRVEKGGAKKQEPPSNPSDEGPTQPTESPTP